jgi:hypothetical protein
MIMAVGFRGWLRKPRLLGLAAACAAPVLYARWVRPLLITWGATRDEATGAYPGDELIPDANHCSTMATTLPAPPEKVWPWLVQMGGDRAGWYSWDRLDHGGEPSADRIVAQWQNLAEGQRLNSLPSGPHWMTVAIAELTAPWCCGRTTGCPPSARSTRGPLRRPGRTWTRSGAFTCGRLPVAGPAWWSASSPEARERSPGHSTC